MGFQEDVDNQIKDSLAALINKQNTFKENVEEQKVKEQSVLTAVKQSEKENQTSTNVKKDKPSILEGIKNYKREQAKKPTQK